MKPVPIAVRIGIFLQKRGSNPNDCILSCIIRNPCLSYRAGLFFVKIVDFQGLKALSKWLIILPICNILHYITNVLYQKGGYRLNLNFDGSKPIYVQVSEWLEREILNGNFESDQKIYSQYQLAEIFNINPATAAKGLNILADENILYKKRGLGMFVSSTAREMILHKRKNQTLKRLVQEILVEAEQLNVSKEELIQIIRTTQIGEEKE
jgi:GntR family transcriptional regulator